MIRKKWFVTGTNTDVGKTVVATGLLAALNKKGLSTAAVKPVAAGCEMDDAGLRNADALLLQQAMSMSLPYEQVNPIALQPAIAPHIAAEKVGKRLVVSQLTGFCRGVLMQGADVTVIEGAGGWRVPLNRIEDMSGLAVELQASVILVVGMQLGCINHAVLTAEAIRRDRLPLLGWVANSVSEGAMDCYQENIDTLVGLLGAPCLGQIPYLSNPCAEVIATYLNVDQALK